MHEKRDTFHEKWVLRFGGCESSLLSASQSSHARRERERERVFESARNELQVKVMSSLLRFDIRLRWDSFDVNSRNENKLLSRRKWENNLTILRVFRFTKLLLFIRNTIIFWVVAWLSFGYLVHFSLTLSPLPQYTRCHLLRLDGEIKFLEIVAIRSEHFVLFELGFEVRECTEWCEFNSFWQLIDPTYNFPTNRFCVNRNQLNQNKHWQHTGISDGDVPQYFTHRNEGRQCIILHSSTMMFHWIL